MSSAILEIARQEFVLHRQESLGHFIRRHSLRALSLAVAYFGMITSGYSGIQDFVRTSASLINLGGFLLPLFALLLGVFSFLTHREYLEAPRHPTCFEARTSCSANTSGLLISVLTAAAIGFGLPGAVIAASIGFEGASTYLLVVFFSCLLAAVFTGLSVLIALLTERRPAAIGVAIAVWIFFELVYGLLMLATTLYLPPGVAKNVLLVGLGGNPIDVVRVLCLLQVGGPHLFGPAGATLIKLTGSGTA